MVPVPHQHAVSFYDHDRELIDILARYVADGLAVGERVVVVATAPHRLALDDALHALEVNPDRARQIGHYVALDAAAMLETFMRGGVADADLFVRHVGTIVSHASADGTPVRVFGEMVALLWAEDNVTGAMRLEELWNAFAERADFLLLCAYPTASLNDASLSDVRSVCAAHSSLQAPSSSAGTEAYGDGVTGHFSQVFLPVPEAVLAVRHFVTGVLRLWNEDAIVPDAELVASELATNAIRHADSPFRVSVDRSTGVVCVAIQDTEHGHAEQQDPTSHEMGGRGMAIVDALSQRWGCDALPAGKVVWAELGAKHRPRSTGTEAWSA
jgi:anti-sigma regulatory factor (Ser/Thr protein kinase)